MISIGDEIKFRYYELDQPKTTIEWFDFKDEVCSHLEVECDDHKWFSLFGNRGIVVDILDIDSKPVFIIKTSFGEVTASIKMIKLVKTRVKFKITRNYVLNKV